MVVLFRWFKPWIAGWIPFLTTLKYLFHQKARETGSFAEVCRGAIQVGIRLTFIPFRYDNIKGDKVTVKKINRFYTDIHYVFHMAWCIMQTSMAVRWYTTTAKGIGVEAEAKADIKWQRIVYFYYPALAGISIPIFYLMRKRKDDLQPLLTAPFHMEKWCIKKGIHGYIKNRKLLGVTAFVYTSCLFMPMLYFILPILKPCIPFAGISMFTKSCRGWMSPGEVNLWAKILDGMYESYAWMFLPGLYLSVGWITIVYPGSAATRRIEVIQSELNKGNESAIEGFREVQLMGILTNTFWHFPLLQLLLGAWLQAEVISLYTVITLAGIAPIEQYLFFIILSIDGAVMIHVHFKLLAEPCLASNALFQYRKQMHEGGSKWMRKYVRSCSPYLVKMADGRFFDRTTPLVVWQFVVDRLVMCLLMKK